MYFWLKYLIILFYIADPWDCEYLLHSAGTVPDQWRQQSPDVSQGGSTV